MKYTTIFKKVLIVLTKIIFLIGIFFLLIGCSANSKKDEKLLKAEEVVKSSYFKKRKDVTCSIIDSYWLSNVYIEVAIQCNFIEKPEKDFFPLFLQFHRADYQHYYVSDYSKAKL